MMFLRGIILVNALVLCVSLANLEFETRSHIGRPLE